MQNQSKKKKGNHSRKQCMVYFIKMTSVIAVLSLLQHFCSFKNSYSPGSLSGLIREKFFFQILPITFNHLAKVSFKRTSLFMFFQMFLSREGDSLHLLPRIFKCSSNIKCCFLKCCLTIFDIMKGPVNI